MTKKTAKKTEISSDLKSLEQIVEKFEQGKIGIEEGIEEYKKAATLIKKIKQELEGLELEIEEIKNSY